MTGPQPLSGAGIPPADVDDDGVLDNVARLPDDIPNDPLIPSEPDVPAGSVADTDVDAPVIGTPLLDDEIEG